MHQFCNRSTCDLFHMSSSSSNNSLSMSMSMSMVFPTPQNDPSSSSVDCTLSLGTPSTRQSRNDMIKRPESNSFMSNLCWAPFHSKKSTSSSTSPPSIGTIVNGDPLLTRRCANCDTTSTPLWRNGPRGPKSLCNACGIRYKKEERRAITTTNISSGASVGTAPMEPQHLMSHSHHHAWTHHGTSQSQFRFMEGDQVNGAPFFTWHVSDRASIVHD